MNTNKINFLVPGERSVADRSSRPLSLVNNISKIKLVVSLCLPNFFWLRVCSYFATYRYYWDKRMIYSCKILPICCWKVFFWDGKLLRRIFERSVFQTLFKAAFCSVIWPGPWYKWYCTHQLICRHSLYLLVINVNEPS